MQQNEKKIYFEEIKMHRLGRFIMSQVQSEASFQEEILSIEQQTQFDSMKMSDMKCFFLMYFPTYKGTAT